MTNPDELLRRHKAALPSWTPLYYEQPLELVRRGLQGVGFRGERVPGLLRRHRHYH